MSLDSAAKAAVASKDLPLSWLPELWRPFLTSLNLKLQIILSGRCFCIRFSVFICCLPSTFIN